MSKSWVFTLNNYTEKDETFLSDLEKTYLIYGREVGANGTPHLQGFITFKCTHRLSAVRKLLPRAHWEIAKSKDAMNYCMKEGDYKIDDRRNGKCEDNPTCWPTELSHISLNNRQFFYECMYKGPEVIDWLDCDTPVYDFVEYRRRMKRNDKLFYEYNYIKENGVPSSKNQVPKEETHNHAESDDSGNET